MASTHQMRATDALADRSSWGIRLHSLQEALLDKLAVCGRSLVRGRLAGHDRDRFRHAQAGHGIQGGKTGMDFRRPISERWFVKRPPKRVLR